MQSIWTPDYVVHTDLPEEQLGAVLRRLGAMTAEYRQRASAISRAADDRRLPLYLYSNREDYARAGGSEESIGFFDGERLLACIGEKADARAWHVIQHEAFHQFLAAKLGYGVPIWLNEGLAEYFGESLYTGDGFVSGIVPPWRLRRLQQTIERTGEDELDRIITMSHDQWNRVLRQESYDIAWSLVQLLAHGDDGRYQDALMQYIRESARGIDSQRAFVRTIGEVNDVQARWRGYWLDYSREQSQRIYARAAVQTVCSFVARAVAAQHTVKDLDELTRAIGQEKARPRNDALPLPVLQECLDWSREMGQWAIDPSPRAQANVRLSLDDGSVAEARFSLRNGTVLAVESRIQKPAQAKRRK